MFYTLSASVQPEVVTLNVGDEVTVTYAPDGGSSLLSAYRLEVAR